MRCLLLLAILVFQPNPISSAQAPDLQKQLEKALKNRAFTLKQYARDARLSYDAQGMLKRTDLPSPWTLYSGFFVQNVKLQDNQIRAAGPRLVIRYDPKTAKMEVLRTSSNLEIRIDMPPGAQPADVTALLAKVFVSREDLAPHVPGYWHDFLLGKPPEQPRLIATAGQRIGPNPVIVQYRGISTPLPKYPEEAKGYALDGTVEFNAEIDEEGKVTRLMIVKPAGAGLDETAAETLMKWKFSPALVDGQPVRVLTRLGITFNIRP